MKSIVICFLAVILITGCKKDEDTNSPGYSYSTLNLSLAFRVDNDVFEFDTIRYFNEAGNFYSIRSLRFYLSQISLIRSDDSIIPVKDIAYVEAGKMSTLILNISKITPENYKGITFNIGVDSIHNVKDGLPLNADNLSMEWPDVMGGGYHFLMLEGYFQDSTGTHGYAMHLGTNSCLMPVTIYHSIRLNAGTTTTKTLTMNINEWYKNPQTFDFNIDGNYIMGNISAMQKLSGNAIDVFDIQ